MSSAAVVIGALRVKMKDNNQPLPDATAYGKSKFSKDWHTWKQLKQETEFHNINKYALRKLKGAVGEGGAESSVKE